MMTKQHYQQFADMISEIKDEQQREVFIVKISDVLIKDNPRFDIGLFREWIKRQINGESLKGLKSGASGKY